MKYIVLFTSMSTLLCCALPALLVSLGFSSVVVSLVSSFPQIVYLSEHKAIIFSMSASVIAISWLMNRNNNVCSVGDSGSVCSRVRIISNRLLIGSIIIWSIGFLVAFVFPLVFGRA